MLHRLRQVNFVVSDLEDAVNLYANYLGMGSVRNYETGDGRRSVLHAGDGTFVGLWRPDPGEAESSAFRDNRGQGPYELAFETRDLDSLIARLSRSGVPVSAIAQHEGWRSILIDQASANGARLRVVEVEPGGNPWPAAGTEWAGHPEPRTLRLRQIAVLVRDLDAALENWEAMFGLQATKRFQVSFTDLEIAVIPLLGRDTFIELAQPQRPGRSFTAISRQVWRGTLPNHLRNCGFSGDGRPPGAARGTIHLFTPNRKLHQPGIQQHLAPPGRFHGGIHPIVPSVFSRQSLASGR